MDHSILEGPWLCFSAPGAGHQRAGLGCASDLITTSYNNHAPTSLMAGGLEGWKPFLGKSWLYSWVYYHYTMPQDYCMLHSQDLSSIKILFTHFHKSDITWTGSSENRLTHCSYTHSKTFFFLMVLLSSLSYNRNKQISFSMFYFYDEPSTGISHLSIIINKLTTAH